jgi:hypothetical protein
MGFAELPLGLQERALRLLGPILSAALAFRDTGEGSCEVRMLPSDSAASELEKTRGEHPWERQLLAKQIPFPLDTQPDSPPHRQQAPGPSMLVRPSLVEGSCQIEMIQVSQEEGWPPVMAQTPLGSRGRKGVVEGWGWENGD